MDADKNNESIVSFSFVVAGFLAYLVAGTILGLLAQTFGAFAAFRGSPGFQHGIPVAIGLIAFLALFLRKKSRDWADEVVTEVRKVVWPSRKDTTAMTTVVCIMVIVAGIGFGAFDLLANQLIKLIVN